MPSDTKELLKQVYDKGVNVYKMLNLYKKRSKLRVDVPEEVIQDVCKFYLNTKEPIRNSFPFFLTVFKVSSHKYFSQQNENESKEREKTNRSKFVPAGIAEIMKGMK